ncbi:hypothetical protein AGMMS49975_16510 [Clostridia bacterium]|nr:hypothetical protein AGMMS49975_16510 [Clostridia bacterium]
MADLPYATWYSQDFEQRNGWIVCRGNKFEVVRIFHYVTKGMFVLFVATTISKALFIFPSLYILAFILPQK